MRDVSITGHHTVLLLRLINICPLASVMSKFLWPILSTRLLRELYGPLTLQDWPYLCNLIYFREGTFLISQFTKEQLLLLAFYQARPHFNLIFVSSLPVR